MKLNLRNEATDEYIAFFKDYLEEIQEINKDVVAVLNEELKSSQYDKLQIAISESLDEYSDIITQTVTSGLFNEWENSKASLHSCLSSYYTGDSAVEVGIMIERNMSELIPEILYIQKGEAAITEHPIVSESGMAEIEKAVRDGISNLEELKNKYLILLDEKYEENNIYITLKPLLFNVVSIIVEFLNQLLNKIGELRNFVSSISADLHKIAEEQAISSFNETKEVSTNANMSANRTTNNVSAEQAVSATNETKKVSANTEKSVSGNTEDISDKRTVNGKHQEDFLNEDNINLAVKIIEAFIKNIGVDKVNSSIDKNYNQVEANLKQFNTMRSEVDELKKQLNLLNDNSKEDTFIDKKSDSKDGDLKQDKEKSKKIDVKANKATNATDTYGRYVVTSRSRQLMKEFCNYVDKVITPMDVYYKKAFENIQRVDNGINANTIVSVLSIFLGQWGLCAWNLVDLFTKNTSLNPTNFIETLIQNKFGLLSQNAMLGGMPIAKVLDCIMPYFKKSMILEKVSKKVWDLTRRNDGMTPMQKLMDQYINEFYELKHNMIKLKNTQCCYFLALVTKTGTEKERRTLENALFGAELCMGSAQYIIKAESFYEFEDIRHGLYLNLVMAGISNDTTFSTANASILLDELYGLYVTDRDVRPNTKIDTSKKEVRVL